MILKIVKGCLFLLFALGLFPSSVFADTEEVNLKVTEALEKRKQTPDDEQQVQNQETEEAAEPLEQTPYEVAENEEPLVGFADQNLFASFFKLFLAFGFIVFIIYFGLRFINKRTQNFRSSHYLQNMSGVSLGANRSIQLVRVGDKLLIVGVGETIQLLKEIEDEVEINKIISQHEQHLNKMTDVPVEKGFNWLKETMFGERALHSKQSLNNREHDDFKQVLDNQLKEVSSSQKKLYDSLKERGRND
ncbi:flagellar biosynthetic protein FliO [Alkalihalobacillus sp. 1P02AB]|uniref:flagellar biosynthetic protein FliO n=1 Tax=Alkalihalobacillus sp. 1P02AB TaxID=3132260 RepID=UPI0039A6DD61